jgi:hypothetical protein
MLTQNENITRKISVLNSTRRQEVFGKFAYIESGGGRIEIDKDWVAQNIVQAHLVKAIGKGGDVVTPCHRLAKEPLERAFAEIAARDLSKLIHSFDGLWVARHMTWNVRRPLSSHSWGIAFDLNAATNSYGGIISPENRALNEVFNRYGFAWGGDWAGERDAMHWELADTAAWQKLDATRLPRLILAVQQEHPQENNGFSYYAVPDSKMEQSRFYVNPYKLARLLGRYDFKDATSVVPVETALQKLGMTILQKGDHLSDGHDPRLYLFVTRGQ